MVTYFLNWLQRRGSWRMIERDGKPYLERYLLFKFRGTSLYLHRFWASDPDELHDHPWRSISFILKGGYLERFIDGTAITRKPGQVILRDAASFHQVDLDGRVPGGAWTLFFTFLRQRDWGFLTKNGWVKADEYTRQEVETYGKDFIYEGIVFPKVKKLR